jgi:hypothetical protein
LVKPGPRGLTADQTLELFTKVSGRKATPEEEAALRKKVAEREAKQS